MDQMMQRRYTPRPREQVERFFAGMDLVALGAVPIEEWRPEPGPGVDGTSARWGAVGRKR